MLVGWSIYQLHGDPHLVAAAKDRALQNRVDVERLGDLGRRTAVVALVLRHRATRDHSQRTDLREVRDQLVGHAVSEIFLVWIARVVIKRKNRDRADDPLCGGLCGRNRRSWQPPLHYTIGNRGEQQRANSSEDRSPSDARIRGWQRRRGRRQGVDPNRAIDVLEFL